MTTTTHGCPRGDSNLTTCCGTNPFELPLDHRMTLDASLVDCEGPTSAPADALDGRDALMHVMFDTWNYEPGDDIPFIPDRALGKLADAILAAGFRRALSSHPDEEWQQPVLEHLAPRLSWWAGRVTDAAVEPLTEEETVTLHTLLQDARNAAGAGDPPAGVGRRGRRAGAGGPVGRVRVREDGGRPVTGLVGIDAGLWVSVVRYALGRRSYIVSWTIQETKRAWPELPERVRAVIARDVADDIDMAARLDRKLGMAIDDGAWRGFLDWARQQQHTKGDDT